MRLFKLGRVAVKTWFLGGVIVLLLGLVVVLSFRAKDRPTNPTTLPAILHMIFLEEINGQTQTAYGTASLKGDCLPIPGRGGGTSSTNRPGTITLDVPDGNVECALVKTKWQGSEHSSDNTSYLIASLSFFRETDRVIHTIPLTGSNSLSPLRLEGNSNLTVLFKADGTIITTVEKLPLMTK